MSDFTIAFIGLPSSGKSSIINSLIGKRILESGICRTTTEYNLLDHIIEDDDNNKFKVMDLPGICDSEEHDVNFNELTNKHILNANLIIWTSDINKAFITTHEVNEYNRIKKILDNANAISGKLYYLIIMLSKCDKEINSNVIKKDNILIDSQRIAKKIKKPDEEISDSDEDTDINDLINKVHEKFPNEDILYFNAFGRSMFSDKSTATLKKFIKKIGLQTKHNITFNISKYIKNYDINQNITYYNTFQNKFILFNNSKFENTKLLEIWDNLTNENKNSFLSKLFVENPTPILSNPKYCQTNILNIFVFLSSEIIKNNHNIYHELIYYYLYIYNNSLIHNICSQEKKYTLDNLIEHISSSFKLLNYSQQETFYNKLLFDYSFDCNCRCSILNNLDVWSKKNYSRNNFENMFNYYIDFYSNDNFVKFYGTINNLIYNKYELNYDETKTILSNFNNYISVLNSIVNDYDYILLNKMQILYQIFYNSKTNSIIHCNYYKLIKSYNNIPYFRLKSNYIWREKNNKIWRKIFSNLQVEYDLEFDIDEFKPISKLELLYYIDIISQNDEDYEDIENDNNSN